MIVLGRVSSPAKRDDPRQRRSAKPCVTLVQIIFEGLRFGHIRSGNAARKTRPRNAVIRQRQQALLADLERTINPPPPPEPVEVEVVYVEKEDLTRLSCPGMKRWF